MFFNVWTACAYTSPTPTIFPFGDRKSIGDDASIGANAVVLQDVPPNSIAVGIPARVLPRREPAGAPGPAFEPEQLLEWSAK